MQAQEEGQQGILGSLTILDLSEGLAGPYAAKLLADYGARVIKVERPRAGDGARRRGPHLNPGAEAETGAFFLALNAGKLSLTLDYETAAGAAVLRRLAEDADAIIEDWPSRRRSEFGLDDESLYSRIPRLVIAQISGFGSKGPLAGHEWDGVSLARALGRAGGGYTAVLEIGLHAFFVSLAAMWRAAQTEHGQVVEVSGLAALSSLPGPLLDTSMASAGGLATVAHPDAGAVPCVPGPFIAAVDTDLPGPAPRLGEHTELILHDLIAMDAAEIEDLRLQGVL